MSIDTGSSQVVLDVDRGHAVVSLAATDIDAPVVWSRWFLERIFVYVVCRSDNHYPLHAGAIVIDGHAVVLSAPAGVGKSTFAFWALNRGAALGGEDILVRHLADGGRRLWGYPRAVYVAPEWLARSGLTDARVTPIENAGKARVKLPDQWDQKLSPAVDPECFVFLKRGTYRGPPVALSVDEAVDRTRDDFSIAKTGPVLSQVEADLRDILRNSRIWEFTLSDDLDESYERLRDAIVSPPNVVASR